MAKKKVGYEINRKEYDRIRKLDHNQMNMYLDGIYQKGIEKGSSQNKGLTEAELRAVIGGIKGIGEKKVEAIIEAMKFAKEGQCGNN